MSPKYADRMANSVDPDQTAPLGAVIGVYTICPCLSVRKLRIITVYCYCLKAELTQAFLFNAVLKQSTYSILIVKRRMTFEHLKKKSR